MSYLEDRHTIYPFSVEITPTIPYTASRTSIGPTANCGAGTYCDIIWWGVSSTYTKSTYYTLWIPDSRASGGNIRLQRFIIYPKDTSAVFPIHSRTQYVPIYSTTPDRFPTVTAMGVSLGVGTCIFEGEYQLRHSRTRTPTLLVL